MADIFAIVLVPTEAGRALVEDGPCGARPPTWHHTSEFGWRQGGRPGRWWTTGLCVWDGGKPVPEGWDRARRVFGWHDWPSDPTPHGGAAYILRMMEVCGDDHAGLCRVVVLDLVDGALVERAP